MTEPQWMTYRLPIRRDNETFHIRIVLPSDLSRQEAERLHQFVLSLVDDSRGRP